MKEYEIPASEMKTGVRYVVTTSSKNKDFQICDHIYLDEDGCIMCREAEGWMEAEDVPAATEGMLVKVDRDYYAKAHNRLMEKISDVTQHLRD